MQNCIINALLKVRLNTETLKYKDLEGIQLIKALAGPWKSLNLCLKVLEEGAV